MVWWLIAAGAAFYLLFNNTAPKAREVFKPTPKGGGVEGEVKVPVRKRQQRGAGTRKETPASFAGAVGDAVYDPAKNPFRAPPPESEPAGGGGSFDDILPDDMAAPEEVPADEEVTEGEDGDFGESDDLDEGSNGQY